ncbi:MAG TPA: PAS domain S-box protein [Candidatus Competibacteraceae bacterium]|nr:PAS domain S-box protein [Candidatus Competibacteraceae bacterium]
MAASPQRPGLTPAADPGALLDHLPQAVLLFDGGERLGYWNHAAASLFGALYERMLAGLDSTAFCHLLDEQWLARDRSFPADVDAATWLLDFLRDAPGRCDLWLRNGRCLRASVQRFDHDSRLLSLIDVTDLKTGQQPTATPVSILQGLDNGALRPARIVALHALIRATLEAVSEAVAAVDTEGNLIGCNQRYIELFQVDERRLHIGQNADFVEEEAAHLFLDFNDWARLSSAANAETASYHVADIRFRDGRVFYVQVRPLYWQERVIGRVWAWLDVSAREQALRALQIERDRAEQYLDMAEVILLVLNPNGRVERINRKGCTILGYSEAELRGRDWFELALDSHWRGLLRPVFEQAMRGDPLPEASVFEHPVRTRRGQRLILWRNRILHERDGRINGLLSCGEDVTEQRAMEHALRTSKRKFATVFQTCPDPILICAVADGHCVDVNQAFEQISGLRREEVLGQPLAHLIPLWTDPELQDNLLAQLHRNGQIRNAECFFQRKSGELGFALASVSLLDLQGQGCILLVCKDISERMQAEAALRASEQRFRSYFEQDLTGIFMARLDGNWLDANRAFCGMLGYEREELLRIPWPELTWADDLGREAPLLHELGTGQRDRYTVEKSLRHKDGRKLQVLASMSAVRRGDGAVDYLIGVVLDITVQKLQGQQLMQARKMEAVGQLTGGIAHDFNNLLTIISGNLELLALSLPTDSELQELVEDARSAARDGRELTRQMLLFARGQALETSPTELSALILGIERLLRRALRDDVELELRWQPGGEYWALLDRHRFESVLVNLMINASDAMPHGGKVTLALELADPATPIQLNLPAGDYLKLDIRDTGCGMPPEVLARACEPFFTTKEPGKGTGLGLAMAYTFLKQSGGHLWLESEPGQGTTVHLLLPATGLTAGRDATAKAISGKGLPAGSETLLVVEDEPRVRSLAARYLRELGYRVLVAGDGHEALTMLESRNDIDLLFSDVMMPGGLNGRQLAHLVRTARPELRVVLTTGFDRAAEVNRSDAGTRWPLLHKPYSKAQLAQLIRQVLDADNVSA